MNKETKISLSSVATQAKFLIPALCLASALAASGTNYTWDGGGGGTASGANWGTATSWNLDSGFPNALTDSAFFGAGAANNVVTVDNDYSVQNLSFTSSATVSSTFTASGGTRTITVGNLSTQFRQNLTLNNVILNKVAGNSFNLFGGLSTLTLNNGAQWNLANFAGVGGQFNTQNNRSITSTSGSGSISVGALATLNISGGASTITIQNGGGAVSFASSGLINVFQGVLALTSTSTLGGTVDFNGPSGSSTLRNSGTLTANNLTVNSSGSNTDLIENTAGTFTFAGALTLNTPISVTGGTLAGVTTSASGTGGVTFTGGTLSPAAGGVGTLSFPSTLNLSGGSLSINITGDASADRVNAGGASLITLGGTAGLSVTSSDVTDGTIFTILSGGSLSGTFAGLANGATVNGGGQNYTIGYTGGNVTLTAVPEPQFYAGAVALGLLGFTVWRRQQKVS